MQELSHGRQFSTDVVLDTYYESADLSSYSSVYYILELKTFTPGGKAPSDKGGKPDAPTDLPKKTAITGETIYSSASFALVKVR